MYLLNCEQRVDIKFLIKHVKIFIYSIVFYFLPIKNYLQNICYIFVQIICIKINKYKHENFSCNYIQILIDIIRIIIAQNNKT